MIRNTTVLNARNFNNYAYAHNTRAVTAASRTQFVGGQSINRGANHITEASLRAQIAATEEIAQSQQTQLGIVTRRVGAGGASRADVLPRN